MIDVMSGGVWPYLVAAFTAIAGALGLYWKGRSDAKAKRAVQDLTAHKETVERVLDETPSDDPADVIRDRLRDRAGQP
jgi:hypothetical protein